MNIDAIWKQAEEYEEYNEDEQMEVMWVANYSRHTTFGDIQEFIEKWDVRSIENAIEELDWIPTMEAGEDPEMNDDFRYDQVGHRFREIAIMDDLKYAIWRAAKPKKKKFF